MAEEKKEKKMVVCSPSLKDSQERKDSFIRVLDNHIKMREDESKKES